MSTFRRMNADHGTIGGAKRCIALSRPSGYIELWEKRLIEPFWYKLTAEWLALQTQFQPLFMPDQVILRRASNRLFEYTGIRIAVI